MAAHNILGKNGELLAINFLIDNGYEILHKNWRHSYYEIDIIAVKDTVIHFVEVKARTNDHFGYPEESVDEKKMENLIQAADEYLSQYPDWKNVQFDILAISFSDARTEFLLIEDVYV
jgi:putative endonuclease